MHHRKTFMYINFQKNRVCRSVKTVYTNLFAQFRKLHKLTTTNNIFLKIDYFRHAPSLNIHEGLYQFSAKSGCRSVKTVHTNLFAQYRKLHKFATTNINFEKIHSFRLASS